MSKVLLVIISIILGVLTSFGRGSSILSIILDSLGLLVVFPIILIPILIIASLIFAVLWYLVLSYSWKIILGILHK